MTDTLDVAEIIRQRFVEERRMYELSRADLLKKALSLAFADERMRDIRKLAAEHGVEVPPPDSLDSFGGLLGRDIG